MITEKTLAEFTGDANILGWVYLFDNEPMLQAHLMIDHTSYTNGKPDMRYSIFWRTTGVVLSQLQEWARELVLMRSWQREIPKDPIQVAAYYHYFSAETSKYQGKDVHWFLFGKNLDPYDTLIQEVHEKFLYEQGSQISFASYTFDFFSVMIVQADTPIIPSPKDMEIIINLKVPVLPKEFLTNVFNQTALIPLSSSDLEDIWRKMENHFIEIINQP